ncbi:hypothetical protein BCEP4_60106 [Burkholderia cepacia]|nr:hypothetical protein BCEP4_60106 [Burkholderia cepacia]
MQRRRCDRARRRWRRGETNRSILAHAPDVPSLQDTTRDCQKVLAPVRVTPYNSFLRRTRGGAVWQLVGLITRRS